MVNVGTGNMLLQDDDMEVPHKGIALSFVRTYNSQSGHDVNATDAAGLIYEPPGMYGNGWTNTLDAHIARNAALTIYSIFDVDGARYDYDATWSGNNGIFTARAGNHATLAYDGVCGYLWTKKSGTTYYFYAPGPHATCPQTGGSTEGYTGRLYQIIGRNRNTYATLSYSWDGVSSLTGKISQINVQTESGLNTMLAFGDVNGHRLLSQITYPDGMTSVLYGYDGQGNLSWVSSPANNSSGARPIKSYGYQAVGSGSAMLYVGSPRWNAGCSTSCGSDGGILQFAFAGSSNLSSTLTSIWHEAVVSPSITDGTNTPLRSGYSTTASWYLGEYYTTGVTSPTYRDTDGHATNWVIDGTARPTQVQRLTAGTNYLVTNLTWDGANNMTSMVDPRGGETDVVYDLAGNAVAIADPFTSDEIQFTNAYRPTHLFDYDPYNNVVASCDPTELHPNNDWSGQYAAGSDSYCTSLPGAANHQRFAFAYPSYEPYGEMISTTTPSGYSRTYAYDAAGQGGSDYGLPTRVYAAPITQYDNSSRQLNASFTYDVNGNVICHSADVASGAVSILKYDAMNRVIASADGDDASLTSMSCAKTPGLAGSTIATTLTYYPDGTLATSQTPSEAAAGYGTLFSYDSDGDSTSTAPYHLNPQAPQTATLQRWYDGADRLIETLEPADPATTGDIPIAMRYIYDLSQNGSAITMSGASVTAHGNAYETQKNKTGGWIDFKYAAYDASDRVTTDYAFAPCPAVGNGSAPPYGPIYCSQAAYGTRYDWDSSPVNTNYPAPGMLVGLVDGLGESRSYTYDGAGNLAFLSYAGDGNSTLGLWNKYDPNGRPVFQETYDHFGHSTDFSYSYTTDGALQSLQNAAVPTTTSYSFYSDGLLKAVSSVTGAVNQPNLYQYAYRNDGLISRESFGASAQSILYGFTPGGRPSTLTDFSASPSVTSQYDNRGRLVTYTTPAGSYSSIGYDPEGRLLQFSAFDGETVTSQYNVRGDLVGRTFTPNPVDFDSGFASYPGFQYSNVQGVLVQNTNDQYDGRTGAPLIIGGYPMAYDAIGRMIHSGPNNALTFAYDAENRLVGGDTATPATAGDPSCATGGVQLFSAARTELNFSYDAQGQLAQDTYSAGGTQYARQWYWDRGRPLYTLSGTGNANKTLDGYQADGIGIIPNVGAGLTITDSDLDGAAAQRHNRTGHSKWYASNVYHQECVSSNPIAASPGYSDPFNGVTVADDGSSDQSVTVDAAGRAYLSRANGFTTPDNSSSTPYSSVRRELIEMHFNCPPFYHWDWDRCVPDSIDQFFPPVLPPPQVPPIEVLQEIGRVHARRLVSKIVGDQCVDTHGADAVSGTENAGVLSLTYAVAKNGHAYFGAGGGFSLSPWKYGVNITQVNVIGAPKGSHPSFGDVFTGPSATLSAVGLGKGKHLSTNDTGVIGEEGPGTTPSLSIGASYGFDLGLLAPACKWAH